MRGRGGGRKNEKKNEEDKKRPTEGRRSANVETKESFYAQASWLSTTKILSITEKRVLLNSPGIDIHSKACYVKVTTGIRAGSSPREEERTSEREKVRGCEDQAAAWL